MTVSDGVSPPPKGGEGAKPAPPPLNPPLAVGYNCATSLPTTLSAPFWWSYSKPVSRVHNTSKKDRQTDIYNSSTHYFTVGLKW